MASLPTLNPRTWDPLADLPDLTGKVAIVTGSTTGVGLGTVKWLALKGAKVYMAARFEPKAKKAISGLREEHPEIKENQVEWLKLDLSDVESIVQGADIVKSKETKLDILVNNAAASIKAPRPSSGWEPLIATDHVGHFIFTNLMLPLLKSATKQPGADVRVVTVSSNSPMVVFPASYEPPFTTPGFLDNPAPVKSASWSYGLRFVFKVDMFTYSVAKLANAMFAQELHRRFKAEGLPIISTHVNPGGVYTDSSDIFAFGGWLIRKTFLTPSEGGKNSAFAAAASAVRQNEDFFGGKYLEPVGKVTDFHSALKKDHLVQGIWSNTQDAANRRLRELGLPELSAW